MWPALLNITRDDCRRTLRRLELEAYSNMIDVFRAQGALEDNRKKLLEELRAVLHISNDRHSAEARRVANDELLATIAEQLAGPNTGLGWISEGRRKVPLMPRGIPQTTYTEIADKAAEIAAAENKELQKLEAERLVAPRTNKEEIMDTEGETAESALTENMDEILYPPIATEDESAKIWETEIISRKRKVTESGVIPDDAIPPVKNIKNLISNTNQKHPNVAQIYSKFSQPATSRPISQSKHSYNQVSKVSTSKSNQTHSNSRASQTKQRAPKERKNASKALLSKAQMKKSGIQEQITPTKQQYMHEYAAPPNSFQASYAQSLLGQPEPAPSNPPSGAGAPLPSGDLPSVTAPSPAVRHPSIAGKPCQLIIKKRGDVSVADKKVQMSEIKILQKPNESLKLLPNRPVVLAQNSMHKSTPAKILTTKVLGPVGKAPLHAPAAVAAAAVTDKVLVVSKHADHPTNSKIIISAASSTPSTTVTASSMSPRIGETITAKGIPATDIKVSAAKTFLLNPKSGQKMVVVPAKARPKQGTEGQSLPLLHFKGMATTMRLVPVSSAASPAPGRPAPVAVVSRTGLVNTIPANAKVVSVEPIKTANMADIVPVKGLTPVTTPKTTRAIMRPASAKGNVIVVQKSATIGKALTFTKNGNDMNKIIMGKNVNQLLQAKQEQTEGTAAGNVIVLELNNDQAARTTTMSEILDSRATNPARVPDLDNKEMHPKINEDTPVLFDTQIVDETCNANSLDSTAESISDIVPMDSNLPMMEKDEVKVDFKDTDGAKDTSSVTDWEIELETVSRKGKDDEDKLNSLHLDLGMSSDSDSDFIGDSRKTKSKHSPHAGIPGTTPRGDGREPFESASGLSHAARTLLSQLQDEGSSSNDSSFALKSKIIDKKVSDAKSDISLDKSESEALTKAKEKLSEKVAKSQLKRIDVYSTAISSAEMNLDAFSYLEEGMMADEEPRRDLELCRLLADDSTDSKYTSQASPSHKQ